MPTNAETRRVYRVEHADHSHGPFDGEGTWMMHAVLAEAGLAEPVDDDFDQEAFHCVANGFPGPANDPGLRRRWLNRYAEPSIFDTCEFVCGCRSDRQLARWFPAPLADYLDRQGYELTVWEVPRKAVAFGSTQVMFDRNRAECVARHPVAQLHKEDA